MTCDSCPYYSKLEGQCRRHPPQPFLVAGPGAKPVVVSAWAPAQGSQWCGEHPRRQGGHLLSVAGDA